MLHQIDPESFLIDISPEFENSIKQMAEDTIKAQLKEMNISSDNLDWVTEQIDQTIDEEVERQTDKPNK